MSQESRKTDFNYLERLGDIAGIPKSYYESYSHSDARPIEMPQEYKAGLVDIMVTDGYKYVSQTAEGGRAFLLQMGDSELLAKFTKHIQEREQEHTDFNFYIKYLPSLQKLARKTGLIKITPPENLAQMPPIPQEYKDSIITTILAHGYGNSSDTCRDFSDYTSCAINRELQEATADQRAGVLAAQKEILIANYDTDKAKLCSLDDLELLNIVKHLFGYTLMYFE